MDNVEDDSEQQHLALENACSLLEGGIVFQNNLRQIDPFLNEHVLQHMRRDDKFRLIKSDQLILNFGTGLLKRNGLKAGRRIASRMRLLARVLKTLQNSVDSPQLSLSDFIDGTYFDAILDAVEK
jgi:hypothetical protein